MSFTYRTEAPVISVNSTIGSGLRLIPRHILIRGELLEEEVNQELSKAERDSVEEIIYGIRSSEVHQLEEVETRAVEQAFSLDLSQEPTLLQELVRIFIESPEIFNPEESFVALLKKVLSTGTSLERSNAFLFISSADEVTQEAEEAGEGENLGSQDWDEWREASSELYAYLNELIATGEEAIAFLGLLPSFIGKGLADDQVVDALISLAETVNGRDKVDLFECLAAFIVSLDEQIIHSKNVPAVARKCFEEIITTVLESKTYPSHTTQVLEQILYVDKERRRVVIPVINSLYSQKELEQLIRQFVNSPYWFLQEVGLLLINQHQIDNFDTDFLFEVMLMTIRNTLKIYYAHEMTNILVAVWNRFSHRQKALLYRENLQTVYNGRCLYFIGYPFGIEPVPANRDERYLAMAYVSEILDLEKPVDPQNWGHDSHYDFWSMALIRTISTLIRLFDPIDDRQVHGKIKHSLRKGVLQLMSAGTITAEQIEDYLKAQYKEKMKILKSRFQEQEAFKTFYVDFCQSLGIVLNI